MEQINIPEKNIIDEDSNVVESEESIDLELKIDNDSLRPMRWIETEAANQ